MLKNRVLIADDSEINREMLSDMLGDQYDFIYAGDGTEVIEILESNQSVDIILLDINMPKMDGFEVMRIMNERHWIDEIPVIIISSEDGTSFIRRGYEMGATDYIMRPFYSFVVRRRVRNILIMYSKQDRLILLVEKQIYSREKMNNALINVLSNVMEQRNHELGSHTLNVQNITHLLLDKLVELTDQYKLTNSDISQISTLSALHDIGKIRIPEEILNKPGRLTPDEWEQMKTHTIEGDKILSDASLDQNSKFVRVARNICRWHHEKYDGSGYPDGLAGDDIPIEAQVVSMADAYDALTSDRSYKKAFSHEKAIDMLLNGECGVFSPLMYRCLSEVSESLKGLKASDTKYDYQTLAVHIAEEILERNKLPHGNVMRLLEENERRRLATEDGESSAVQP